MSKDWEEEIRTMDFWKTCWNFGLIPMASHFTLGSPLLG